MQGQLDVVPKPYTKEKLISALGESKEDHIRHC